RSRTWGQEGWCGGGLLLCGTWRPTYLTFYLFLRTFGAVLRAALPTIADAGAIERAADSVIAYSGQVLDAAAANQYHGVLLQVMAFTADVAGHFIAVGQADSAHLAQRRIRLL